MKRFNVKMAVCSSLGIASLWLLMRFSVFYTMLRPLLDGVLHTDAYINECFAVYMLFLALVCIAVLLYYRHIISTVFTSKYSPFCLAACASLGMLLMNIYANGGLNEFLLGVGIFLSAVFAALLLILWIVRLMQEPVLLSSLYAAITICVICCILACVALSDSFTRIAVVVSPLVSGTLLFLSPKPSEGASILNETSSLKTLDWRFLVPVCLLISLSSIFNKLVSSASSALISEISRLLTDVVTITLFSLLLVYLLKKGVKKDNNTIFFIISVALMLLGLLFIMVLPVNGDLVGGAILMSSFYCFVYLFLCCLCWDHTKCKVSPVVLSAFFVLGSIVIPLILSNTIIYQYALDLQAKGFGYSITFSAMLSFLVAVLVFVVLGMSSHKSVERKEDSEEKIKRRCRLIAKDYGLTDREEEVLFYLYQGRSRKMITETLMISPSTTQGHINHIYQKTAIHKRDELIEFINTYESKMSTHSGK